MLVSLQKVAVNGSLGFISRPVIAVVNDGPRHPAKNGLDNIQELSSRRQWRKLDGRRCSALIVLLDLSVQLFGYVP